MQDLKPEEKLKCNAGNTMYTNEAGVRSLLLKSKAPTATEVAKQFGIKEEARFVRKKRDDYMRQKCVYSDYGPKTIEDYGTDLYLLDQKPAVEIDGHRHAYRDAQYEQTREPVIVEQLGCRFMRIDLNDQGFRLSTCFGQVMREIVM